MFRPPSSGPIAVTVTRAHGSRGDAKPPIVLVHGAWHGAWCWTEHFTDRLADAGFTSYAVDLRGHGDSPGDLRTARIAHYVSDIRRVVVELEGAPILIGHSMGGFVAQHFVMRHPARAVVLMAPVPSHGAIGATVRVATRFPGPFLRANATWSLGPIVDDPHRAVSLLFGPRTDRNRALRHARRLQSESYLAYLEMLAELPKPRLVNLPMLVVAGEHDALFSPSELSRTAAAYGADLEVFAGLGHDLMLEDDWPNVANRITDWLTATLEER